MKIRTRVLVLVLAAPVAAGLPSLGQQTDQPLWIAQNIPPGYPIQPRPPDERQRIPSGPDDIAPPQPKKKFDAAGAQHNARDLAALAQKIPAEVEQASRNVLSKDLIQQLKQIEKLAKRLRAQLSP